MAQFSVADVFGVIDKLAPSFGIDPAHAKAIVTAENSSDGDFRKIKSFSTDATSPKGARGLMQVMPATARGLQLAGFLPETWKNDPENLESQVSAGLAAMKDVRSRMKNPGNILELASGYNGNPVVHAAYNAGKPIPAETVDYHKKVSNAANLLGVPKMSDITLSAAPSSPSSGAPTSSVRTRSNVNDPRAMQLFMNTAMGIATDGGLSDQGVEEVGAAGTLRQTAYRQLQGAIASKAVADGELAAADSAQLATAAARRNSIISRHQVNPDMADNAMFKATDYIIESDAKLRPLKAEIDEKTAVGFFDNPLMWLVNQTRLPGMVASYNNEVKNQTDMRSTAKTLYEIAKEQQDISTNIDADLILRSSVAKQASIAATAQENLSKAQIEASAATIRDRMVLAQLDDTKLRAAGNILAATRETETRTEGMNAKEKAADAELQELRSVNDMIKAAGGIGFKSVMGLKTLKPNVKTDLLTASASNRFGKSFAESFGLVAEVGSLTGVGVSGDLGAQTWLQGTAAAVKKTIDTEVKAAKHAGRVFDGEKATPGLYNTLQGKYQTEANEDMRTADVNNPFKLAYSSIAKMPELATTNPMAIFLNKYGPKGTESTFATVDEDYIIGRFASSVAKGTMTAADAAKAMHDFYKVGVQQQQLLTKWPLFGLEKPAKGYVVKLPSLDGKSFDLSNIVDLETAVTYKAAREATRAAYLKKVGDSTVYANPVFSVFTNE